MDQKEEEYTWRSGQEDIITAQVREDAAGLDQPGGDMGDGKMQLEGKIRIWGWTDCALGVEFLDH